MQTVTVLLVVAVAVAQAQVIPPRNNPIADFVNNLVTKSFSEFKAMNPRERLNHVRTKCADYPRISARDDATISANLEENMKTEPEVGKGFQMGFNCLSALSREDIISTLKTSPPSEAINRRPIPERKRRQTTTPPASMDWRTKGYVTPVQNQGQCGSCWTFSANGAMEGAVFKKTGKLPNFSEQNLVDCVNASSGCNGGWMTDAYDYSIKNPGVANDTAYPYVAKQNTACKYVATTNAGKVASYAYTKQDDEADLKAKLATIGPIAVAIDASNIQNYVSGIFSCANFTAVNHGVLAVGYGTDSATNTDYYIIKNSWGSGWGENGYIRIVRNKGSSLSCGIPTYANYPVA
ncbi:cathepsin L1 [Folsomia candida]|uniref:Cathepsin K n=1 Tax=Folsomia candida TaxID=158441 RepID=A0A226E3S8_FOLCA|nr:cathepsin L1 [Folsomia candida]OXA52382.1 Cathepsin K [Folsomia candida]